MRLTLGAPESARLHSACGRVARSTRSDAHTHTHTRQPLGDDGVTKGPIALTQASRPAADDIAVGQSKRTDVGGAVDINVKPLRAPSPQCVPSVLLDETHASAYSSSTDSSTQWAACRHDPALQSTPSAAIHNCIAKLVHMFRMDMLPRRITY